MDVLVNKAALEQLIEEYRSEALVAMDQTVVHDRKAAYAEIESIIAALDVRPSR